MDMLENFGPNQLLTSEIILLREYLLTENRHAKLSRDYPHRIKVKFDPSFSELALY